MFLCASGDQLTFSVWFCASFHKPDGVLDELAAGFDKLHDLIHVDFGLRRRKHAHISVLILNIQNRQSKRNRRDRAQKKRESDIERDQQTKNRGNRPRERPTEHCLADYVYISLYYCLLGKTVSSY